MYVAGTSIVTVTSSTLVSILYSHCGVCKNESVNIVPHTFTLAAANGVPVEAVAVLLVAVRLVVVNVHTQGLTLFTFTCRLVALVAELTQAYKSNTQTHQSIVVLPIESVFKYVPYIFVLLFIVIVSTSSAVVTGTLLNTLMGYILFTQVHVIAVSSGNISTQVPQAGGVTAA